MPPYCWIICYVKLKSFVKLNHLIQKYINSIDRQSKAVYLKKSDRKTKDGIIDRVIVLQWVMGFAAIMDTLTERISPLIPREALSIVSNGRRISGWLTDRVETNLCESPLYSLSLSCERASKGDLPKYAFLWYSAVHLFPRPLSLLLPLSLRYYESIWNDNAIHTRLSACSCINDDGGLAKVTDPWDCQPEKLRGLTCPKVYVYTVFSLASLSLSLSHLFPLSFLASW